MDSKHHITSADQLVEKVLSERRIFSGRIFCIDELVVEHPNGNQGLRDVVRHPGATGIIALNDAGEVLLVSQWRTALNRVTVEIPAGRIEADEDPLVCAERELEEETGYRANSVQHLTTIETCAGFCDEKLYIYQATGITSGVRNLDDDEFVIFEWVDLDEAVRRVMDGRITDSKTVVAILMVAHTKKLNQ